MIRITCLLLAVTINISIIEAQSFRSIDGAFNNIFNPEWGATGDQVKRVTDIGYADGISAMSGADRPNPRHISNVIFAQPESTSDVKSLSDFVWVFGQFIDHDITFVRDNHTERLAIEIPSDDQVFTPGGSPISMSRSLAMRGTGVYSPREYANEVTAFIDGSAVYGSTRSRADWLRTHEGGKLKTSEGNNLPWNTTTGEFNAPIDLDAPHMEDPLSHGVRRKLYVAGDARANENPLLASMHSLFVREHNRMCDVLAEQHPDWTDERLYQMARKWTSAYLQSITYNEWLPSMGIKMPHRPVYRQDVNPQISNVFSAAAFRVGHTLINGNIMRVVKDDQGDITEVASLRDVFFNPQAVSLKGGIEPYLRGMGIQVQQKMDCQVIDDVRNFLFGSPDAGGLDLAAININRGRERGLSDYNTVRSNAGLPRIKAFSEITKHTEVVRQMEELYGSVDNVDPWVGMLAEDYMPNAILGSTLMRIIEQQFRDLRDGDRFFYSFDRYFSEEDVKRIESTSLHDIIMRNTDIEFMQDEVFVAMPLEALQEGPSIEAIDLNAIAYPNPVESTVYVKLHSSVDFDADITIYSIDGRVISQWSQPLERGDNVLQIDELAGADAGYYHVLVERDRLSHALLRIFKN